MGSGVFGIRGGASFRGGGGGGGGAVGEGGGGGWVKFLKNWSEAHRVTGGRLASGFQIVDEGKVVDAFHCPTRYSLCLQTMQKGHQAITFL